MFETLPCSGPRRPSPVAHALTSMGLHGALLAAGVLLTRPGGGAASAAAPGRVMPIDALYLPAPRAEPTEPLPDVIPPEATIPETTIPAVEPPEGPLPPPPIVVPDIPSDFVDAPVRVPVPQARSTPSPGQPIATLLHRPRGATRPGGNPVYTEALVDEPVRLVHQPPPEYPVVLRSAGITGRVVVEFVVDTLGGVERESVRVVGSSHPGFEEAARASVIGARFRPARAGERAVRQLVRQALRFVLEE